MPAKRQANGVESSSTSGTVGNPDTPFRRMVRDMAALATVENEDSNIVGEQLSRIYSAETFDEIWDADQQGPMNAQMIAGCELSLYNLVVKYSTGNITGRDGRPMQTPWVADDGRKMYITVTAARISDTGGAPHVRLPGVGEEFQFTTGAQYLTAKLFTFFVRGGFGNGKTMEGKIQATDLGDGQAVLKLVRVPTRSVRAERLPENEPAF